MSSAPPPRPALPTAALLLATAGATAHLAAALGPVGSLVPLAAATAAGLGLAALLAQRGHPRTSAGLLLAMLLPLGLPAAVAGAPGAAPVLLVAAVLVGRLPPPLAAPLAALLIGLPLLAVPSVGALGLALAQLGALALGRPPESARARPAPIAPPVAAPAAPAGRSRDHELRTPLNAVLGLAGLLAERPRPPADRRTAEQLLGSTQLLAHQLGMLLDLGPGPASAGASGGATTELVALAHQLHTSLAPVAAAAGTRLELSLPPEPVPVCGASPALEEALAELLHNALAASPGGRVSLAVATEDSPAGPRCVVDVRDDGPGLPAALAAQLAGPAPERAPDGASVLPSDRGLGRVAALVRAQGGELVVLDGPPPGAGLRLLLRPAAAVAAPAPAPRQALPPGLRVLVVEDEPVNRKVVCAQLTSVGCTCVVATNGQQALSRIDPLVQVVLMDQEMPVMDGLSATRALRQRGYTGLVLALTANEGTADHARCRAAGMDGVIVKPVSRDALVRAISRHLGRARGAAAAGREAVVSVA